MKKLLTLLLTAVLILTFSSIFANAADTVNPDGYKFDIKAINGSITGEDGIIITKQEAIANANLKWPIILICEKVSDNVYKVKQDPISPGGTAPSLTLNKNEIIIAIHSAANDLTKKDTYKNVEQKVAAQNVKAGMYFAFEGIDLANGTCNNGKAICSAKAPQGASTESSISAASSASSKETSSAAASSAASKEESNAASSETKSTASSAAVSSGVTSEIEASSGLDTTTIIIIIAAVVVVAAVIVVVAVKKKK